MAKFIPLKTFTELYNKQSDLLLPELKDEFMKRLDNEGASIAEKFGFSLIDFQTFRTLIENPSAPIYFGWVEQVKPLFDLLTGEPEWHRFEDKSHHLDHKFGGGYKKFISPFVAEQLVKRSKENDQELEYAFSFTILLDVDHCATVEDQLYKSIRSRVETLVHRSLNYESEQDLINDTSPLCSDEIKACVNYLSRASYATRLGYVDDILSVIRSKACTVRYANWILKQMEDVQLNPEHEHKIYDLRKDLRKGELEVKNVAKGKTPIRWSAIITVLVVVLVVGSALYLMIAQPFSKVEDEDPFTNNSSFTQFTIEERKKIDSLLREVSGQPRPEEIEIDPMNPIYTGGPTLTLRKEFNNENMEQVYQDLFLDAELKDNYPVDSCTQLADTSIRLSGAMDLAGKSGSIQAMLKNESGYDIQLIVASSQKQGVIYSMYVKDGTTHTFKLDLRNTVMIVAGKDYAAFKAPNGAQSEELPSENFNVHFCDTDVNYRETINTAYRVISSNGGKAKFMVTTAQTGYVHLVDLNQILEEH